MRIPEYRSMNFAIYQDMLDRYADSGDLRRSYEKAGLNGLEVIRTEEPDGGKVLPGMVNGVHLFFHLFWMDWWLGNTAWLDREFDSREQWLEYYGGRGHESYLSLLRADLDYAERMGAKYVVFHVSEGTLRESFTGRHRYSDREVVDACLDMINTLLDERDYPFDFLVENLWWSGLTLKDAALTKRLIEGIHTEKKGVMLDTGHYMNTNPALRTPAEAAVYLHEMIDAHEREGLLPYFKGMHLHLSLSGEYAEQKKREWEAYAPEFDGLPFYERYRVSYEHVARLDRHLPFQDAGAGTLVERIAPRFLTYEFSQESRAAYEKAAAAQSRLLFPDGLTARVMNITIRKYREQDTKEAASIWNRVVEDGVAFPQTEPLDAVGGQAFFEEQSFTGIAVDRESGEVVGLYILHPNNVGRCGHICNASYAVKAGLRGQGIGEQLVRHCLQTARELGFRILQFNAVVKSNQAALALYRKIGFVPLGVIPGGFLLKDGRYEDIIPHYYVL